jgi:hypothetical protein
MNARHSPSPAALWLLTLAVFFAHCWVLEGSWRDFVLTPGARSAPPLPATVRLQLQAPQTGASAQAVSAAPKATPKPARSIEPVAPTNTTADTSNAVTELASSTQVSTALPDKDPPSTPTSSEDAPESIARTTVNKAAQDATNDTANDTNTPAGPRITEAGSFPPVAVPAPMVLLYKLQGQAKGFNYSAKGELRWLPVGQRYEARLEISAFLLGSRVQTSRGEITANGLQPQRFSDKVRSEVAAHFDWAQRKVIFSANTPQAELQNGAQDHLSAFIALAALLGGDLQRYLPDGEITLQAVGPREADVWRVQMNGQETLDLPIGKLSTYKLTRPPVKPYDLNVELWMAPSLGFLPARIRLTQHNGDFIDQLLQESSRP